MKNDYILITPRGKSHKRKYVRVYSKEEIVRAFNRGYNFIICEQTIELNNNDIVGIIDEDKKLSKSITISIHTSSGHEVCLDNIKGSISIGSEPIIMNGRPVLKNNKSI